MGPAPGRPVVSVVIPTYNRAALVARAIRSVLAQTVGDIEVLVVDDASSDDTAGVVRKIQDPRLTYLRLPVRRGGPAARNAALAVTRGAYVAFLDSDDEWLPDKLQRQLEVFRTSPYPRLGLVYCGSVLVEENGERPGHQTPLRGFIHRRLLDFDVGFATSCFVIRREVFEAGILFDEQLAAWQDWDFLVRVADGFQVDAVPAPLVKIHRDHQGDHVWSARNLLPGRLHLLAKYNTQLPARVAAREHRGVAKAYFLDGNLSDMRRHLRKAFRQDPLDPRMWIWLPVSLLPHLVLRRLVSAWWHLSERLVDAGLAREPLAPKPSLSPGTNGATPHRTVWPARHRAPTPARRGLPPCGLSDD
jgi:glycosyltransferase involved in cell wall biosynthesis